MSKATRQDFLNTWFSDCDGYIEIRLLPSGQQGFFPVGAWDDLNAFISKHTDTDIYFGVATRGIERGTKEDVLDIPGAWTDIDFKVIPEDRVNKLVKECPLQHTFAIQSGGGYHVYWKFTEPEHSIQAVELLNRQIAQYFGSDPVHNCDRILRVPETFNYKYTPKRSVKLISSRDTEYDMIDFNSLPPLKAGSDGTNPPGWREEATKGTSPGNRHGDASKLVGSYIRMGLDDSEILTLMGAWDKNNLVSIKKDYGEAELGKIVQSIRKKDNSTRTVDGRDIPSEIYAWLEVAGGEFHIDHLIKDLGLGDNPDLKAKRKMRHRVTMFLRRLTEKGLLRAEGRHGWFKKVPKIEFMDLKNASTEPIKIILPFKLSLLTDILPGSIIAFAGAKDAGKTTALLNIAKDNFNNFKVFYFNSEMSAPMMLKRAGLFEDVAPQDWVDDNKIQFIPAKRDWGEIMRQTEPGPDKLYIIDYIQDYEEAWRMASHINEVHEALGEATAVLAIQKNRGRDVGFGGERTMDKPVVYVGLERGVARIEAMKSWKGPYNPNGRQMLYKIAAGSYIKPDTEWEEPPEGS